MGVWWLEANSRPPGAHGCSASHSRLVAGELDGNNMADEKADLVQGGKHAAELLATLGGLVRTAGACSALVPGRLSLPNQPASSCSAREDLLCKRSMHSLHRQEEDTHLLQAPRRPSWWAGCSAHTHAGDLSATPPHGVVGRADFTEHSAQKLTGNIGSALRTSGARCAGPCAQAIRCYLQARTMA